MDALAETINVKPKRRSGYERVKIRNAFLSNDITALEGLVETLLGHLERAIRPDMTEHDRARYRHMANDIRGHLAKEE